MSSVNPTPTFPNPVIDGQVNQAACIGFQNAMQDRLDVATRGNAGNAIILEHLRSSSQLVNKMVDVASAQNEELFAVKAASSLLSQGLSDTQLAMLGLRAVGGQPQASAADAGVNSGGPTPAKTS